MPEPKTKLTDASVEDFIDAIENDQVRDDCRTIAGIMQKAAKAPPRMWGASIVGFGTAKYRYANGKEAEFMLTAFSPRKQNITLYLTPKLAEHREAAFLARRLTEIACDMPLEIARTELARRAPDVAALTDFFDRHNFGPLLRRQAERLALLPLTL